MSKTPAKRQATRTIARTDLGIVLIISDEARGKFLDDRLEEPRRQGPRRKKIREIMVQENYSLVLAAPHDLLQLGKFFRQFSAHAKFARAIQITSISALHVVNEDAE
jgi:hypothetical protein